MGLFGTSGIRGDAEKLFTEKFCLDIARSFIKFLKIHGYSGTIALGNDPRSSSPRIKKNLVNGLSGQGYEILDEGVTPIPSINWLLKSSDVTAAIEITGSHIAPELNGVKFYAHEEEISLEDQTEIEKIYEKTKNHRPTWFYPYRTVSCYWSFGGTPCDRFDCYQPSSSVLASEQHKTRE